MNGIKVLLRLTLGWVGLQVQVNDFKHRPGFVMGGRSHIIWIGSLSHDDQHGRSVT